MGADEIRPITSDAPRRRDFRRRIEGDEGGDVARMSDRDSDVAGRKVAPAGRKSPRDRSPQSPVTPQKITAPLSGRISFN